MSVARLEQMVIAEDATMVSEFCAPSFFMESNRVTQDHAEFAQSHTRASTEPISPTTTRPRSKTSAVWPDAASGSRRTTRREAEPFEGVQIATFDRQGRIDRFREIARPDWSAAADALADCQ
jgi:hypothetical protein